MKSSGRKLRTYAALAGVIFLLFFANGFTRTILANGQLHDRQPLQAEEIAGRYEGVGHSASLGEVPLLIEIRSDKGNITGSVHTPLGDFAIPRGSYTAGKLTLAVESYDDEGTLTASLERGRLVGEFVGFGQQARVDLKRIGPPSPIITPVLSLSKQSWRDDLQYLARELPRNHKNAFHRISKEQFERAVAELDSQIPSLPDNDIVIEMSRIVAMIGDGHTNLRWGGLFARLPLRLFWFANELRVTETISAYRRALGSRVVKIGKATVAEAYERDQAYISQAESKGFILDVNANNMTYPVHLQALGLIADTTQAQFTFEDNKGRRFSLNLKPAGSENVEWIDAARKRALYRQNPEEPLRYTYLASTQTLYFAFRSYPRRREFSKFSQELFDFMDHHPIKRAIVDLRENGGGDFTRGREFIVSGFKQRSQISRHGHLFVIIGRKTFSAGMVNAVDFRKEMNAIIVGEPSGQRPNSYSENREFYLPNSHLTVSYSTQYYKFQDEDTPGIIPDKRIDPDWASYKEGRDPVLEWILAYSSTK